MSWWRFMPRDPIDMIAEAMWRIHVPEATDWVWGKDISQHWAQRYRDAAKTITRERVGEILKDSFQSAGHVLDLPDGLFMKGGHIHFTCRQCGEAAMWPGEIEQWDQDDVNNLCGGSPRCCP